MGNQCCSNASTSDNEINGQLPAGSTLGQLTLTQKQLFMIVRLQARMRAFLARRYVQRLREENYSPGMQNWDGQYKEADYENENVQVSQISASKLQKCSVNSPFVIAAHFMSVEYESPTRWLRLRRF